MTYEERKAALKAVQELRGGRALLAFLNFDRQAEPAIPGLSTQFHADVKEALFRILKESDTSKGVDLMLYTRGGDTNAVWPLVSLIREFDPDFEVLIPFRCHSSGTLAALGGKKIILTRLSELSPIDPSTGNQFNPRDPVNPGSALAISVEDVRAYREFVLRQAGLSPTAEEEEGRAIPASLLPFVQQLTNQVHPLALGNVYRVLQQIEQLADNLLSLHPFDGEDRATIVKALTTKFYSHLHMINRDEAKTILGQRVEFATAALGDALDAALRTYEDSFGLRRKFFLGGHLSGQREAEVRFVGAVAESTEWSYLFETRAMIRQVAKPPANVQIQVPFGQPMPLVPGLPVETQVEIRAQGWIHNKEPLGVTT